MTILFNRGCKLVVLGCNTATAIACRTLQQNWLPEKKRHGYWLNHNIIGIIAPTVEAATQTSWGMTTPQYPQKYNSDRIALFATKRTIDSGVYREEINKRCPKVSLIEQACPHLAGAIERGESQKELEDLVRTYVAALLQKTNGIAPHQAILGCTHFPLIEDIFRAQLPQSTRILSQPRIVTDSLDDYLARHSHYQTPSQAIQQQATLLTTGNVKAATDSLKQFWPDAPRFSKLDF